MSTPLLFSLSKPNQRFLLIDLPGPHYEVCPVPPRPVPHEPERRVHQRHGGVAQGVANHAVMAAPVVHVRSPVLREAPPVAVAAAVGRWRGRPADYGRKREKGF